MVLLAKFGGYYAFAHFLNRKFSSEARQSIPNRHGLSGSDFHREANGKKGPKPWSLGTLLGSRGARSPAGNGSYLLQNQTTQHRKSAMSIRIDSREGRSEYGREHRI